jgi:divalent metal cation (Fe/Co/Zn/Cd) transporter
MALNRTERVLLTGVLLDSGIAIPLCAIGFLSGSASATTESVRTILLVSIDVFSLAVMMAINRRRFTRFEFGLEKLQIMVQLVIAAAMSITMVFLAAKIWQHLFGLVPQPNYLFCLVFAGFSYLNVVINAGMLRQLLRQLRDSPSLILRGQIKNRTIMLTSSVAATFASAFVIVPDPILVNWVDTAGAVVVFAIILFTVVNLLRGGVLSLLDAPIDEREKFGIYGEVLAHFDEWDELAFLRTRRVGHQKYVEIGLVFPGERPLEAALAVCGRIEARVRAKVDNVMIAVRPADPVASVAT